jgi:lysophospholipid acyltransferase (LPLAT)-like uncharacterized protein
LTVWLARLIGWCIACFLHAVRWTYRFRVHDEHYRVDGERRGGDKPPIFAVLHAQQITMVLFNFYPRFGVITSQSKDGEIAATVLRAFGMVPLRGSSTRGGQRALEAAVEHVAAGWASGITIDGPRGPRGEVKRGIVEIARRTGRPIVPAVAVPRWRKELRSWDRFEIALPFSRVELVYGPPLCVAAEATPSEVFAYCDALAKTMAGLESDARARAERAS